MLHHCTNHEDKILLLNKKNCEGLTVLAEAIIAGDIDSCKFLDKKFPDSIRFNFSLPETPRQIAAKHGRSEILKYLVELYGIRTFFT